MISLALPLLVNEFALKYEQTEMVAGFMMIGCTLGALVGGSIADCIGRKRTVYLTCFIFIIGSIILSCSLNLTALLIGRVVVGVGVAISAIVDVAYLTEVSPNKYRGAIVSTNELMITVGLLTAYLIDYRLTSVPHGWRYMFLLPALLSVVWMLLMCRMPESPRWLVLKGMKQEALYVFQSRADSMEEAQIEFDYAVTVNALRTLNLEEESSIFHWKYCLLCACILMAAQNMSGHGCVLAYSIQFFESAGVASSGKVAMAATVLIGIIKVVFTVISMCLVDLAGRKMLLLVGICGIVLAQIGLVVFVPNTHSTSLDTSSSSSSSDLHSLADINGIMCIVATCLFVASYAIGFGPMTYLITSELFPDQLRGRAIGYSMVINWLSSFAVVSSFYSVTHSVGMKGTMGLYLVSS